MPFHVVVVVVVHVFSYSSSVVWSIVMFFQDNILCGWRMSFLASLRHLLHHLVMQTSHISLHQ